MRQPLLIAVFFFCSIMLVRAQQLSPYLCDENLYPVVTADSPVMFPYASLTGTTAGSDGVLTLLNKSDKKIQYYLVVMEFFDHQGGYLFSAPVYNVDKEQQVPFDVPFKSWLLANWPGGQMESISPGSQSKEAFGTHFVALTCPASIRISVIWLKYDDGNEFKYVSDDLNLSTATQADPMRIKDVKNAKRWAPLTVSGSIQIDAQGRVQISDMDSAPQGLREWFNRELSGWGFTPPWVAGKPVSVRIPFLLILADNSEARDQVETMRKRGARGPLLIFTFTK